MRHLHPALTGLVLFVLSTLAVQAEESVTPAHALAMHGTPKYGPDFEHFDYVNPDAPRGGTMRRSVVANGFDSFHPFVLKGVAAAGIQQYAYDSLMASSDDEPFTMYGLIAESVETPEDRSYVVFNLRPDARFSDGKPITAEDVVFSFRTLVEKGHPFYRNYYASVSKATAVDSHRVRFEFGEDTNRELPLILGQMPIFPKHFWQDHDFTGPGLTVPVTSGPYTIDSFEAGRSVVYERQDDYWGADLPVNVGRHNFDRIRFDYYTDSTVALEAFKSGNFDLRIESSAKNWATGYQSDALETGRIIKETLEHQRPAGMQAFVMNTRRAPFDNRQVRKALAYGFDFAWTNKNLFYGQYKRTASYFENSELASSGLPGDAELRLLEPHRDELPEAVFNKTYQPPSTQGENSLRDNLRQALQLLNEAGYEIRDGTMVHKQTGDPLAFQILLRQKTFERVVLPFAKNLEKLGIKVDVRLVDTNQYVQRVRQFNYDMIVQTLPQSRSPGNEQRDYWHSSNAGVSGSKNYMGIDDPVVDDLVSKVIQAPDREALVTRTRALDRVLLWGHYVIPQWYLDVDRVAYWQNLAHPETIPESGTDLSTWWSDES